MRQDIIKQLKDRSHYFTSSRVIQRYKLTRKLRDLQKVYKTAKRNHNGCFAYCTGSSFYPHILPPDMNTRFIELLREEMERTSYRITLLGRKE